MLDIDDPASVNAASQEFARTVCDGNARASEMAGELGLSAAPRSAIDCRAVDVRTQIVDWLAEAAGRHTRHADRTHRLVTAATAALGTAEAEGGARVRRV
ncbi:MAG: hypothetical protein J2P18_17835 [Nocardia sp.]|nr:hypothetical protein [Nocardia sp.]